MNRGPTFQLRCRQPLEPLGNTKTIKMPSWRVVVTDLTRPGSWSQREDRAEEELTIRLWEGLV